MTLLELYEIIILVDQVEIILIEEVALLVYIIDR